MKKSSRQLDKEITSALHSRSAGARKRRLKSPYEVRIGRLKALRAIMGDVYGDDAWNDTDLEKLESWINVDDELPDREWLDIAKNQLIDENVLPAHAGAPSLRVYQWNDVFISTYRMNIDGGTSREDAIASARQNAFDTVTLSGDETSQIKTDPKLYGDD